MPYAADSPVPAESKGSLPAGLLVVGASLVVYAGALAWLAHHTASSHIEVDTAANWLVAFSVPAGLVYFLGLWPVTRKRPTRMKLLSIIAIGFAARAIVVTSPPSLEDDYYRYLWDGAVTAHGLDPYHYSPTQVVWGSIGADSVPSALLPLAHDGGSVLEKINHPGLTTIYPPIAQLAFAASHAIAPWSTYAWRGLLLVADTIVLLLLLALLRYLAIRSTLIAWYWWNPILVRETYGGAHMDVLVLPFVLAAILLAERRRTTWATMLLAFGSGVKLWPIVLIPVVLRRVSTSTKLLVSLGVLLLTLALVWLPTFPGGFGPQSGFLAYTAQWQNNSGAFRLIQHLWERTLPLLGTRPADFADMLARCSVGVLFLLWLAWHARRPITERGDILRRSLLIIAAMFLLSPTQFPWYYLWLLPFLAVSPRPSLLAYSSLLPLYYIHTADPTFLWLEHTPVWLLLAWELVTTRIETRRPLKAADRFGIPMVVQHV